MHTPYRTWHTGLNCSIRLVSRATVRIQEESELTNGGLLQTVLFNVILPPHFEIASENQDQKACRLRKMA